MTGKHRTSLAMLAVMLLAALVGFFHLTTQPLWNDEAFSFFVAYRNVANTLSFMRQDTQPPVYYLLLTGWLRLGHDPLVLRSLSVLAIVASVPLLYDAGRRLLGAPTALLAVLLFVLDSNVVLWEQRARPYAMQTGFVALAFWGFVRIWIAGRDARPAAWLAWVFGGALALLTQYPAGFFLLGANVAIAIRTLPRPAAEAGLLWRWSVAQVAMILLWLPWMAAFIGQFSAHLTPAQMAAHHRIFLIGGAALAAGLRNLLSIPTLWRAQALFALLYAVLAVIGAVALWRRHAALPILGTCAVPLAVCVAGFALVHPVFGYVTLNFVWLLLPYSLLIAAGILFLPRRAGMAAVVLLLLGNLWGLRNAYAEASPPLDQVAGAIRAQLQPGDGLLLSQSAATRWGIAYYLGPPYLDRLPGLDVADAPAEGWPIRDLAQTRGLSRLWLVLPDGETPAIEPRILAPAFVRAWQQRFGVVLLERYDRKAMP
jgi:4-amino-4-deoxy-L-arabinose transferase-like glycosyltransferase